MAPKKIGRPTSNPKISPRQIRLDSECVSVLKEYCEQEKISESEAIRRGIKKLRSEIKK